MYVMTPEYGAATQLEKIDMLDFADIVAVSINLTSAALWMLARCEKTVPAQP
jgi:putative protein kinase ArgK-like GTPase of G3E family